MLSELCMTSQHISPIISLINFPYILKEHNTTLQALTMILNIVKKFVSRVNSLLWLRLFKLNITATKSVCVFFFSMIAFSRSMRGGSRPNSLKLKTHPTFKENGDISMLSQHPMMSTRRTEDFDIKTLQQKKAQAEMKRYQILCITLQPILNA